MCLTLAMSIIIRHKDVTGSVALHPDRSQWPICHTQLILWVLVLLGGNLRLHLHYDDVIMSAMVSQITSLSIVYSTVYSGRKSHETMICISHYGIITFTLTPFPLAFVRGIHREFPAQRASNTENISFDDVILAQLWNGSCDPFGWKSYNSITSFSM